MKEELQAKNAGPQQDELRLAEYRPSDKQVLKEHEIRIQFLNRGCVVMVGCKTIAFQHVPDAIAAINDYVLNPYEEQQRWRKTLD
jgi:hypothetical protein